MLSLLLLVICGIGIAFFSTQNTQTVDLTFLDYSTADVPVYMVVLVAFLSGIFICYIINTVNALSSSMKIHGKDTKLKESRKEIEELTRRIHKLELENERLQTQTDDVDDVAL
jgi:uncharacterized integral membrane protein